MTKFAAKIFLVIFGVLLIQFLYFGITTTPEMFNESDSLAYHIPIARQLASGSFIPPVVSQGIGFYPGVAEIILAIFVILRLPLNTFGVLGFALLFYFSIKVAERFGLSKETAIVYAGVIVTLQSVLRWPLTQTVDIWLNVFFVISLMLLKNPKSSIKYFLTLGIFNGLLIGTKYSGLLFFVILIAVFGKEAFRKLNLERFIVYLIPVVTFGFSWYIRNYLLTGNPLYPANFLFLAGNPDFYRTDSLSWSVLGNVIRNPSFLWKFIEALFSEYLGWALVLLLPFRKGISKLVLCGTLIFLVFITLLLAIPIVSNLRYIYPAMSTMVLAAFILFEKKHKEALIAFSIIMAVLSLLNLDYHPKILILAFLPVFYLVFINERFNLYNRV